MKGYFLLVLLFLVVNTFTTIWVVYRVSAALEILRTAANVMDEVRHVQESVTALRESLSQIKSMAPRNEVSRDAPWNRINKPKKWRRAAVVVLLFLPVKNVWCLP